MFDKVFSGMILLFIIFIGHLYGVGLIVPDRGCHLKTFNWVIVMSISECRL